MLAIKYSVQTRPMDYYHTNSCTVMINRREYLRDQMNSWLACETSMALCEQRYDLLLFGILLKGSSSHWNLGSMTFFELSWLLIHRTSIQTSMAKSAPTYDNDFLTMTTAPRLLGARIDSLLTLYRSVSMEMPRLALERKQRWESSTLALEDIEKYCTTL